MSAPRVAPWFSLSVVAEPYGDCPNCGSADIEMSPVYRDADPPFRWGDCNDCGAEWRDSEDIPPPGAG